LRFNTKNKKVATWFFRSSCSFYINAILMSHKSWNQ